MADLMTLSLPDGYRSGSHRLGRDFYGLALPCASLYRRAVGFLASSVLSCAPDAFKAFFEDGGTMKVVCSPRLQAADAAALFDAMAARPTWRRRHELLSAFEQASAGEITWSELLAWLVVTDRVRIKVALVDSGAGALDDRKLYHEKIGVFEDSDGNIVAFSGSANESRSALLDNFERVDVFTSWGESSCARRSRRIQQQAADLWRNETSGVRVVSLAVARAMNLIRISDEVAPVSNTTSAAPVALASAPEYLAPRDDIQLFEHQKLAIRAWARAGGRGVLEMATGSGKTITALSLASQLYDAAGPGVAILIIAPYIHLVDQWCDIARSYGLSPVRCAEGSKRWEEQLSTAVYALNAGRRPLLSVAVTSSTLATPLFQREIRRVRKPLLVIGDEVHNYGARASASALPLNATYRVGLSATPDRWMDDAGTERVRDYFGESVFSYSMADAIRDEVLTRYRYHPYVIELDPDEVDDYLKMTRLLARYLAGGSDDGDMSQPAKTLLIKRARLLGSARRKLPMLKQLLAERRDRTHMLVYCGDGRVEGPEPESTTRQIAEAVRIIGNELGMRCASYTAETPPKRRRELLVEFGQGFIQVLVAIRCLDEGVDIPATREAFLLASSTNPRQFIQRRGRVLRRYPGKERASVHDFLVAPPLDDLREGAIEFGPARQMFASQLRRAREFANLADNGPVARRKLLEYCKDLDLLGAWEEES